MLLLLLVVATCDTGLWWLRARAYTARERTHTGERWEMVGRRWYSLPPAWEAYREEGQFPRRE